MTKHPSSSVIQKLSVGTPGLWRPSLLFRLAPLALALQIGSSITSLAQDQTVSGNLTVTQSLKAGTTGAAGGLELRSNGILISKGVYSSTAQDLLSTDQGAGTRLLWYPGKAAFRAGYAGGAGWNETNIGLFSTAFGFNTSASGHYATAMGSDTMASGLDSTAMGQGAAASGEAATAMGRGAAALGYAATAMGDLATASGSAATAMGNGTTASGYGATAMGDNVRAEAYASLAIGSYNVGGGSPNYEGQEDDPLFEIGNGKYIEGEAEVRSNALTVYRNGNMEVNGNADFQGVVTCAPGGDIPMFNPAP